MSGRHKWPPPPQEAPLDLRAVEARLSQLTTAAGDAAQWRGDARDLLAHCRALRAALEPFAVLIRGYETSSQAAKIAPDTDRLMAMIGDMRRAAAVLAQARDEKVQP